MSYSVVSIIHFQSLLDLVFPFNSHWLQKFRPNGLLPTLSSTTVHTMWLEVSNQAFCSALRPFISLSIRLFSVSSHCNHKIWPHLCLYFHYHAYTYWWFPHLGFCLFLFYFCLYESNLYLITCEFFIYCNSSSWQIYLNKILVYWTI